MKNWQKSLQSDKNAQMHTLEATIAALLFFNAIQVGISMMPSSESTTALDKLSVTGKDSLLALHNLQPNASNPEAYSNSSLIYNIISNNTDNITDFLNLTLSDSVSYSLGYRFITYNQSTNETNNSTMENNNPGFRITETILFQNQKTIDESVTAHLCIFHRGILYDICLVLWMEPRGVKL